MDETKTTTEERCQEKYPGEAAMTWYIAGPSLFAPSAQAQV